LHYVCKNITIFTKNTSKVLNKVLENELTKLYYSIGEVAEMYGVNTSLIRFWEKEFDLSVAKKTKKGNRVFSQKDIQNFNKIYQLVKVEGFTLDGAKKQLKTKSKSGTKIEIQEESETIKTEKSVIQSLEKIRLKLIELKRKI
jgi:DNA-binding transcriptional MerR regulator